MTSQANLEYVPNGGIWDGVTEYLNETPPDLGHNVWFLRMVGNGTRYFTESSSASRPMNAVRWYVSVDGWDTNIGFTYNSAAAYRDTGGYLGYDGSLTHDEPVNQVPLLFDFRSHAATFAHQLDDAMGHHSLTSSSEEDRLTTFQSVIRHAGQCLARRYKVWAAIDPARVNHRRQPMTGELLVERIRST